MQNKREPARFLSEEQLTLQAITQFPLLLTAILFLKNQYPVTKDILLKQGIHIFFGSVLPNSVHLGHLPHPYDVVVGSAGEPDCVNWFNLEVDERLKEI